MRIAAPSTPEQTDLDTRRAVAELQRAARANAALSAVVDRLVLGLFGSPGNTVRPVAFARRTSGGNPSNAVDTIETFHTAEIDTDHMFTAAIPDRLIIQTPGIYIAAAQNNFTANGTGHRVLDILARGTNPVTDVIAGNSDDGIAGGPNLMLAVSRPIDLDAGDELYMNLWQNSGGPLATLTGYGGTWLAAIYLQPLP